MADTKNLETTAVVQVELSHILALLHLKAIEQIKVGDYTIRNSAFEGEGDKVSFYGPGDHIIAAIPTEEGKSIPRTTALELLKTYVQWFVGPDLKTSVEDKDLVKMQDASLPTQGDKTKDDEKADAEKLKNTKSKLENSSILRIFSLDLKFLVENIKNMSFRDYLVLEANDADNADNVESSDEDNKKDANEETKDVEEETAPGYYVTYKIEVEGLKSHALSDALKKFGTDLLKGFGVKLGNWRTGASGDAHTLGDLADGLELIFGKIDPDQLISKYLTNLKLKFPKATTVDCTIADKATILKNLKNRMTSKDKAAIIKAEYAVCTKISKRDKSYGLLDTKVVAELLTKSISGLFKKFKNNIKPSDVVEITNYADTYKDKTDSTVLKKEEKPTKHNESMTSEKSSLVLEDDLKKDANKESNKKVVSVEEMNSELEKAAKSELAELLVSSDVDTLENILKTLKDAGVTDDLSLYKDAKHAFLILTKENKEAETKKEPVNSSGNSLLKKLFSNSKMLNESVNENAELKKKVLKAMQTAIDALVKKAEKKDAKTVDDVIGYIPDNTGNKEELLTSSLKTDYSLLQLCFEDLEADTSVFLLFEASNYGIGVGQEIIKKKGFKNLIANIDKMTQFIKSNEGYKPKKGQPKEKSIRYQALELFDKFAQCKTDDEMSKFLTDNFEDGSKETKDKSLRTAFIKAMSIDGIPDREDDDVVTVTFYDYDPEKDLKVEEPLDKVEIEKGNAINASDEALKKISDLNKQLGEEEEKKKGFIKRGWKPDTSTKPNEDIELVANYVKKNEADKEFTIIFQYPPDPSKPNDVELIEGDLGEQNVKNGEDAKEPKPPEIEGWKFKQWSEDFHNITEDKMILAEYEKEDASNEKEIITYWIALDENSLTEPTDDDKDLDKKDVEKKDGEDSKGDNENNKGDSDFFIVPMKGLKYKDDDDLKQK